MYEAAAQKYLYLRKQMSAKYTMQYPNLRRQGIREPPDFMDDKLMDTLNSSDETGKAVRSV